jgi:hypothetical protein
VGKKAAKKSITPRGKRVTVGAAFQQRLARGEEPYEAIEGLNAAILARKILLFVEGREEPVEPDWFADHARVAIKLAGGRVTAKVVRFGRGFEGGPYNWTVSGDGMESGASRLTSQPRPRGPRPTRNWQDHVLREIIRAQAKGKSIPSGPVLAQSCLDTLGHLPDVSAINKLIKDVLDNK